MQLSLDVDTRNEWRRSRHGCTRDPKAGPGTCWFWWEMCPSKVPNCFVRWRRQQEKTNGKSKTDGQSG